MNRFHFPLEKVRDFRRRQLELEEAKLEALHAERQALAAESANLARETEQTRLSLMVTGVAEAQDLVASDLYLRHLSAVKKRLAAKLDDWQARADRQQQAIVEARRRVRLLEKLEERKLREWRAGVDREQENLASELYLARWKR
jgi:flagellar export protein FliJ